MDELISKQAAIDAAHRNYDTILDFKSDGRTVAGSFEDIINALPSVQPEPSTEIQEILEYLDTTLHPIVSPDNWNVYSELYDMVSSLPSAQPEIIMCKNCKYYREFKYDEVLACHYVIGATVRRKPEDFCSRAERRTDG